MQPRRAAAAVRLASEFSESDSETAELLDHFALFGIKRTLAVDERALESRFHTLQMASHPDRFAAGGGAAALKAEEVSASINEAYRVLRDPVRRLKYLMHLYGVDEIRSKAVPKSLMMSVMETQDAIGALEAASAGAKSGLRVELKRLRAGFEARRHELGLERSHQTRGWDELPEASHDRMQLDEAHRAILERLRELLTESAYIETLTQTIDRALAGDSSLIRH